MYYELIVLGIACLLAPICAKLAGYETRRKPFDIVGVGGVFFLLGASFHLAGSMLASITMLFDNLMFVSTMLGWLGLLIGTLWATREVLFETDHGIMHKT